MHNLKAGNFNHPQRSDEQLPEPMLLSFIFIKANFRFQFSSPIKMKSNCLCLSGLAWASFTHHFSILFFLLEIFIDFSQINPRDATSKRVRTFQRTLSDWEWWKFFARRFPTYQNGMFADLEGKSMLLEMRRDWKQTRERVERKSTWKLFARGSVLTGCAIILSWIII